MSNARLAALGFCIGIMLIALLSAIFGPSNGPVGELAFCLRCAAVVVLVFGE